ncbi:hypothetical protein E0504_39330, partial [Parafrankia sp. BMG5.11]
MPGTGGTHGRVADRRGDHALAVVFFGPTAAGRRGPAALAAAMGRAGRSCAVAEFGWPAAAERTADLYAKVTRRDLAG